MLRQALTRCIKLEKRSKKWNRSSGTTLKLRKKLTRHFKAILQESRSPKRNDLTTLTSSLSASAGLYKMFEVRIDESEVEQIKWNDSEIKKKVD